MKNFLVEMKMNSGERGFCLVESESYSTALRAMIHIEEKLECEATGCITLSDKDLAQMPEDVRRAIDFARDQAVPRDTH